MSWRILNGDCREMLATLPASSVQTCVTSPPYFGLRDYGHGGQIGLEPTPDEFVQALVGVFREVRRVLRDDGTVWLNLGDSYATQVSGNSQRYFNGQGWTGERGGAASARRGDGARRDRVPEGYKPKDLLGVPWLCASILRADGWYLRSDIIWHKPSPMPESVRDRPTSAHEHIFLLSKRPTYFYDADAIREESASPYEDRNKRSVWTVAAQRFPGAHFATFPPKLIEPCVLAGSRPGDTVLDPFAGSGTTGMVALRHERAFIGIELNPAYAEMARNRIRDDAPLLNTPLEELAA